MERKILASETEVRDLFSRVTFAYNVHIEDLKLQAVKDCVVTLEDWMKREGFLK